MKAIIKGFIHAEPKRLKPGEYDFSMFNTDMSGHVGFGVLVGPAEFEYEVPADFNPVAQQVASLKKQKKEAERAFSERIRAINLELSKLQAIEFDASSDNPANYPAEVA